MIHAARCGVVIPFAPQPMKYAYEDLSPSQFEALVVAICQFVLGAGAQGFAAGPDGGRDAKFIGAAQLIPSEREPWRGTVIVQAKHTNGYNKTFSDADFYSEDNEDTVLGKELPRVKRLRDDGELDHYLLLSNRRLTGNGESKLRGVIAATCGVPLASVAILGIEQLELWLKRFPEAARIANVDPIDSPLIVSPDELAVVVEHLALRLGDDTGGGAPPGDRVTYARKNELNKMSAEYAKEMRKRFLKETGRSIASSRRRRMRPCSRDTRWRWRSFSSRSSPGGGTSTPSMTCSST